jgi:beta-glucuronidase
MRRFLVVVIFIGIGWPSRLTAQDLLENIGGRHTFSLNGQWQIIIDWYNAGQRNWRSPYWKEPIRHGKNDFYESGFSDSLSLRVPGDWNSQRPELNYYEGNLWYKKSFVYHKQPGTRLFLYFGAVNYQCHVYLNGKELGSHEGGFTPFQFDVTDALTDGPNALYLLVSNQRSADAIPALNYDWWNYGGITRDVCIAEVPQHYIKDYFVQLAKGKSDQVSGWVDLSDSLPRQNVIVQIPELHLSYRATTDDQGRASIQCSIHPELWTPEKPKLYDVIVTTATDSIQEQIGFRTIETKGPDILLNGHPIFLRGVNFHEENPLKAARAYSDSDAITLLTWAKELGCNFVRLTHYPQNEYTVRLAEKMGILLWEEVPLWQGIQFDNPVIMNKATSMLHSMIARDKNRCGIILWSLSNETSPGRARDSVIAGMARYARAMDPTRLITSALNHVDYRGDTVSITDTLCRSLDVIGVNEYLGWYSPWPKKPGMMTWISRFNKPLIMSEFGGEAVFGSHGSADTAGSWTEEFQERLYTDQLAMMEHIPFLRGTCPWILADFRSPLRLNPVYQRGWNRKGLLSDKGDKKKAWYVVHNYYAHKSKEQ